MEVLDSMIEHISNRKNERKVSSIHQDIPNNKLPAKSAKKTRLTFQMIGNYLKNDPFYSELNLQ